MHVVLMASARLIAGRMVVSRRASLLVKCSLYCNGYSFTFHLVA